jgi:hypothetical protein
MMNWKTIVQVLVIIFAITVANSQTYSSGIFKETCDPVKFSKPLDQYIVDKVNGVYKSSLWEFETKANFIIDYIKEPNDSHISNYAQKGVVEFLVFFIFAFFTLIFFVIFFACCCCPYSFCRKTNQENPGTMKKILYTIIAACAIAAILSMAGVGVSV